MINKHNIVGTDKDDRYLDSIEAMICQSVSIGKINNSNGKIHTCIIGPPSIGKKIFALIAHSLNIVAREIQASTWSVPGIIGSCKNKNGDWKVEVGYISAASQGVFIVQDIDKSKDLSSLFEAISPTMEDGIASVSKSGKAVFEAETSIHIDLNKKSHLTSQNGNTLDVFEDTGLSTYIISRFDFICEFPKDVFRQFDNARTAFRKAKQGIKKLSKIEKYCNKHGLDLNRFLKVMTAYLIETYSDIDKSAVYDYIENKYEQIIQANTQNLHKLEYFPDFQMRFRNSVDKFVDALTRLQLSDTANTATVDKAFHLLSRKLEFLKSMDRALTLPIFKTNGPEALAAWLYEKYKDKKFEPEKAFNRYKKAGFPGGEVKSRQFRNWLKVIAVKKSNKKWRLKKEILARLSPPRKTP